MLYFGKIQDDSYGIIAQISCIMPSFHKPNLTDIIGCVIGCYAQRNGPIESNGEISFMWFYYWCFIIFYDQNRCINTF